MESRQKVYIDQNYNWRITYPGDWRVEQKGYAAFTPQSKDAMCGVHITTDPPATTDQLTDAVLAAMTKKLQSESGLETTVVARKNVRLLSGQSANDVLVDLIPGGRSRRLFVVAENRIGYLIDCETHAIKWQEYASTFESFLRSFTINR